MIAALRPSHIWTGVFILLGVIVGKSALPEIKTAAACEAYGSLEATADHHSTMLAACRRELADVHALAHQATDLVEQADSSLSLLLYRCEPGLALSSILHAGTGSPRQSAETHPRND